MSRTYLMSPPSRYWRAEGNDYAEAAKRKGGSSPRSALLEWIHVADELTRFGDQIVVMMPPEDRDAFDMVYMADVGGYFQGQGFLLSNMVASHRRKEPGYVRDFLARKLKLPLCGQARSKIEISSSTITLPSGRNAIVGYGVRAERRACDEIAELTGMNVLPLMMQEPHIHTDTFAKLLLSRKRILIVCRSAFAEADGNGWDPRGAWDELGFMCNDEGVEIVPISRADGIRYATNVREADGRLFSPDEISMAVRKRLRRYGYAYHLFPLPCLFGDGGGAAACLTNDITDAVEVDGWSPPPTRLYPHLREKIAHWVKDYPVHEI